MPALVRPWGPGFETGEDIGCKFLLRTAVQLAPWGEANGSLASGTAQIRCQLARFAPRPARQPQFRELHSRGAREGHQIGRQYGERLGRHAQDFDRSQRKRIECEAKLLALSSIACGPICARRTGRFANDQGYDTPHNREENSCAAMPRPATAGPVRRRTTRAGAGKDARERAGAGPRRRLPVRPGPGGAPVARRPLCGPPEQGGEGVKEGSRNAGAGERPIPAVDPRPRPTDRLAQGVPARPAAGRRRSWAAHPSMPRHSSGTSVSGKRSGRSVARQLWKRYQGDFRQPGP